MTDKRFYKAYSAVLAARDFHSCTPNEAAEHIERRLEAFEIPPNSIEESMRWIRRAAKMQNVSNVSIPAASNLSSLLREII